MGTYTVMILINFLRQFNWQLTFTDILFFPFLAIAVVLYFVVSHRYRWIMLLVSSVVMYLAWAVVKLVFPLAEVFVSWLAAMFIERQYKDLELQLAKIGSDDVEKKKRIQTTTRRKCFAVLWIAIVTMVAMLVFSKSLRQMAARFPAMPFAGRLAIFTAPLGISYYTLSLIGYVVDVYWKKQKAERNYFKLMLFALYFPKILQGPISSYAKIGTQLCEGHRFDYKRFCYGVQLMLWGYFKKLVIADRLNLFVSKAFGDVDSYSGSVILVAAILSTIQMYCDFSGCMDMGCGMSQIFGIELEKNFNHPFFAKSAAEFWRRWHITLGGWFRDYVYMPLASIRPLLKLSGKVRKRFGKRAGLAVLTIPVTAVVWFFTGLWHGTGTFLLWGIYWGTILITSNVFSPEFKKLSKLLRINTKNYVFKIFQMARTFLLFVGSCIITTPANVATVFAVCKKIFTQFDAWNLFDGTLYKIGLDRPDMHLAFLCIALLAWVSHLQEKESVRDMIARQQIVVRWAIYYMAFFTILIFGIYGMSYDASAFVYMQF